MEPVSQPAPLELPKGAIGQRADQRAPWIWWPNLCSCCAERGKDEEESEADDDALPPGETGSGAEFDRLQFFMQHTSQEAIRESYDMDEAHDEIGKGACGVVFHARHKLTGKSRAVKLIAKEKVRHAFRFRREIEIMKRIAHPNITQLVETFEDTVYIYMVMEHVEGGELFDRVVDHKYFSERDAAGVMRHVFTAVSYLHTANVIHRDLKPENILMVHKDQCPPGPIATDGLTIDGHDLWDLKLIDWGYAVWCTKKHRLSTVCGTCYYIAPEVLRKSYGSAVDMWSSGVILYILLTGTPPFAGKHAQKMIASATYNDGGLPRTAADLIGRCLVLDPTKRISAAEALQHPFF